MDEKHKMLWEKPYKFFGQPNISEQNLILYSFYFLKQFGFTAKLSGRYTGFPDMQYSFIGLASLLSKYMFFKRLSLQKSRSCLDESHFALHNARELKLMVT